MAKHKLLLADDSVTIQKVVNLTFADEGNEVTAVGDGDAAMQKFVESVPDLVMVDVNMPGVDGYRICEMIKQDEETKHIPVILLVGSFEPFDEAEARRVGADDFLTKPFQSIRQLVNKVSDLLNGKTSDTFSDEAIAVNSFDDILEMIPPIKETTKVEDFGDAAMDDEMIQTSQIGSLPVNEAQKFESPAPDSPTSADEYSSSEAEAADEDFIETSAEETSTGEITPKNEFSPVENPAEIAADAVDDDEPLPRHENIYEFASEQESADGKDSVQPDETSRIETERPLTEESETVEAGQEYAPENETAEAIGEQMKPPHNDESDPSATFETVPGFELDDFDLLELPQSKKFKGERPLISAAKSSVAGGQPSSGNLSLEEIEAIADKVVEKLSDKVIKKIVREVFSQMTKKK